MNFYVKRMRIDTGRVGYVGPIRSERQVIVRPAYIADWNLR